MFVGNLKLHLYAQLLFLITFFPFFGIQLFEPSRRNIKSRKKSTLLRRGIYYWLSVGYNIVYMLSYSIL